MKPNLGNQPEPNNNAAMLIVPNRLSFSSIVETLKNAKELLLLALFFGGSVVWVANYFATHEELDSLECFTKLNVRLLQAEANVNYTEQLAKDGRIEMRDQQHILDRIAKEHSEKVDEDELKATQLRLDNLNQQAKSFANTTENEKKATQKALTALTQNSCLIKDQRTRILGLLQSGEL
jgi:hypothetical protein